MTNLTTQELTQLFPVHQGQDCGCGQGQACLSWQMYTNLDTQAAKAAGWWRAQSGLWVKPTPEEQASNLELLQRDAELTAEVVELNALLQKAIDKYATSQEDVYKSSFGVLETFQNFFDGSTDARFNGERVLDPTLGTQLHLLMFGDVEL